MKTLTDIRFVPASVRSMVAVALLLAATLAAAAQVSVALVTVTPLPARRCVNTVALWLAVMDSWPEATVPEMISCSRKMALMKWYRYRFIVKI